MKAGVIVIIVWMLLIGAEVLRFNLKPPAAPISPAWLATRKLPANHQLTNDDLRKSDTPGKDTGLPALETMVGLHLKSGKNAGDKVERSDLDTVLMRLSEEKGQVSFILHLDEKDAALHFLIDSGSYVMLCVDQSESDAPDEKSPLPKKDVGC